MISCIRLVIPMMALNAFLNGYLIERGGEGDVIYLDDFSNCTSIQFAKYLANGLCECDTFRTLSTPRRASGSAIIQCGMLSSSECGYRFISTAKLSFTWYIPIRFGSLYNFKSIRKVYVWNMVSPTSLIGSWLDVTDQRRAYFRVSDERLIASFSSDFWTGQLIRVEYNYKKLCNLIKVEGSRIYPVEIPIIPTEARNRKTKKETLRPAPYTTPIKRTKTTTKRRTVDNTLRSFSTSAIICIAIIAPVITLICIISFCYKTHRRSRPVTGRPAVAGDLTMRDTGTATAGAHSSPPNFQQNQVYLDHNGNIHGGVFGETLDDPPPPYPSIDEAPPDMLPPPYESVVNDPSYQRNNET